MEDRSLVGYFDYNATTPISEVVAQKMSASMRLFCNASSSSSSAQQGKQLLEEARQNVAKLLNCVPLQIAFTSGGSEANNWAIKGTLFNYVNAPGHVITSAMEHPSVLSALQYMADFFGFEITYLNPKSDGTVAIEDVTAALRPDTQLISIMYANNETGAIQPIRDVAEIAKRRSIIMHTDCVQIIGKRLLDVSELGVDLASFSGHKFYGPKGIGGLFIKQPERLQPLIHGGGQEMGLRAGTENLLAIAGLSQAAKDAFVNVTLWDDQYIKAKSSLIEQLKNTDLDIEFNGTTHCQQSVANTLNFSIAGVRGEALSALLDQMYGIVVSIGSACSNNSKEKKLSHVLKSMGLDDDRIQSALRVSLGRYTTEHDIQRFVESLERCAKKLLQISTI